MQSVPGVMTAANAATGGWLPYGLGVLALTGMGIPAYKALSRKYQSRKERIRLEEIQRTQVPKSNPLARREA